MGYYSVLRTVVGGDCGNRFETEFFVDSPVATPPIPETPKTIVAESAGSVEEMALAPKKKSAPKPSTTDKGKDKAVDAPKEKKHAPSVKPKGIVISSPTIFAAPAPELEEGAQIFVMTIVTPYL